MVLVGQKQIAEILGLSDHRRVAALVRAGAPIRVLWRGRGRRYVATVNALIAWIDKPTLSRR